MSTYYIPLSTALWTFPLIALLAVLPYIIYNYRKYGAVSVLRTVILFSFAFYLQCAYFLVILPLPDPDVVAALTGPTSDLVPFHFIPDFIEKAPFVFNQPSTWLPTLKSPVFLEPLFNSILLVPFGIYLAYYFKAGWKKVLLSSFLLSLFFEISQLTGLFWLYPRPYRIFSIDDLMLNSLGGLVGYFIYSGLLRSLPKRERMDEKSAQRSARVSYTRRFCALIIDLLIMLLISRGLSAVFATHSPYVNAIVLCVYSVAFSLLTRGKTVGRMVVRIKAAKRAQGKLPFALAVTIRYLGRSAVFFVFLFFSDMAEAAASADHQRIWIYAIIAVTLLLLLDFLISLRRGKRLWYERLSGTENVSTFQRKKTKASTAR
ncbi:MAG: VanZ family protein [Clostridiales Family XIII bacterium]|jgi:glycopeptide antibiotics resistance protein|nr:VanZ family protein [Clostridiales Family XIII bacterium]